MTNKKTLLQIMNKKKKKPSSKPVLIKQLDGTYKVPLPLSLTQKNMIADTRGGVFGLLQQHQKDHTTIAKEIKLHERANQEQDVIVDNVSIMEIKLRDLNSTINSYKFKDQLSRYEDFAAKKNFEHIYFIGRIITEDDLTAGIINDPRQITTTADLAKFNSKMRDFPNILSWLKFSDTAIADQIMNLARKPVSVKLNISTQVMDTHANERPYVKAMASLIPGVPIELAKVICKMWGYHVSIQQLEDVIDDYYEEKSHEDPRHRVRKHYGAKAKKVYKTIHGTFLKGY